MTYERKIDELGRLVLPVELRNSLNIDVGDTLIFNVSNDNIMMSKKIKRCVFCGNTDIEQEQHGKYICVKCVDDITMFDSDN